MDENKDKKEKNQAGDRPEIKNEKPVQGSLHGNAYEAEDIFENAEPWDPVETKIVVGSFIAALIFLVIFGFIINKFILQ